MFGHQGMPNDHPHWNKSNKKKELGTAFNPKPQGIEFMDPLIYILLNLHFSKQSKTFDSPHTYHNNLPLMCESFHSCSPSRKCFFIPIHLYLHRRWKLSTKHAVWTPWSWRLSMQGVGQTLHSTIDFDIIVGLWGESKDNPHWTKSNHTNEFNNIYMDNLTYILFNLHFFKWRETFNSLHICHNIYPPTKSSHRRIEFELNICRVWGESLLGGRTNQCLPHIISFLHRSYHLFIVTWYEYQLRKKKTKYQYSVIECIIMTSIFMVHMLICSWVKKMLIYLF